MRDIIIISLLNGFVFAAYCFLVSRFILQKKTAGIKKVLFALIPFLMMYYCILCLLESIYTIFLSGLCAFMFIKIIFQENIFISLFISLIIHVTKIFYKILFLTIINNKSILLINTYKTLDWSALYINLITLIISTIFIYLLRNYLRKLLDYVSSLKHRRLLLYLYINLHIAALY